MRSLISRNDTISKTPSPKIEHSNPPTTKLAYQHEWWQWRGGTAMPPIPGANLHKRKPCDESLTGASAVRGNLASLPLFHVSCPTDSARLRTSSSASLSRRTAPVATPDLCSLQSGP